MTQGSRASIRIVPSAAVEPVPLGDVGSQRVLLGEPLGDQSPLLMGVSSVAAGRQSPLIEHDTAEIAYVLKGSGWMVTDTSQHGFVAGDAIVIDARCWHAIRAADDGVEMVYVFPARAVPPTRTSPVEPS